MKKEDFIEYAKSSFYAFVIVVVAVSIIMLIVGCTTTRVTETSSLEHHVSEMLDRMDSLVRVKTVVQQDSAWRETILRQFQSIKEKSDTSHTFVVDTAGRVIKETLVINNVRETSSETDRQEIQVLSHRIETMDSTMNLMRQQLERSDSLLQSKETVVEKKVPTDLSWWQQARIWLGNLVLVALLVAAAIWGIKKKAFWIKLLRL